MILAAMHEPFIGITTVCAILGISAVLVQWFAFGFILIAISLISVAVGGGHL